MTKIISMNDEAIMHGELGKKPEEMQRYRGGLRPRHYRRLPGGPPSDQKEKKSL